VLNNVTLTLLRVKVLLQLESDILPAAPGTPGCPGEPGVPCAPDEIKQNIIKPTFCISGNRSIFFIGSKGGHFLFTKREQTLTKQDWVRKSPGKIFLI
jgi:hypothetical protein